MGNTKKQILRLLRNHQDDNTPAGTNVPAGL
jgi:hypothetical protein